MNWVKFAIMVAAMSNNLAKKRVDSKVKVPLNAVYLCSTFSECRHYSNNLMKNEFLCVDLTYIYALLHDGLKLSDDTNITVRLLLTCDVFDFTH